MEFAASVLEPVQSDAPELVPQNTPEPTVLQSPLPEINALAAISVESNLINPDKIIFEKSSQTVLPIASLTKLMTAVVVLDNPVYNFENSITVDGLASSQDGLKQDVKLGDTFQLKVFLT